MFPKAKVISLDVTGTLFSYIRPIGETYANCAKVAGLIDHVDTQLMNTSFRKAYKELAQSDPCFGYHTLPNQRLWWKKVVIKTLEKTGIETPNQILFDNFFRIVYQEFASPNGYKVWDDAKLLLDWVEKEKLYRGRKLTLGVITNSPLRTVDTVLPMLQLNHHFDIFVSSSDIGHMKPSKEIFEYAFEKSKLIYPNIQRNEIVHIGDDYEADYKGALDAGFQAFLLDRGARGKGSINSKHEHDNEIPESVVIHSLEEIIAML